MRLLGHQPQEVTWVLGWWEHFIAGLGSFDDGSTRGTLWGTTVCERLCAAVEAEVDGIACPLRVVVRHIRSGSGRCGWQVLRRSRGARQSPILSVEKMGRCHQFNHSALSRGQTKTASSR
jgi:hypothetical protein